MEQRQEEPRQQGAGNGLMTALELAEQTAAVAGEEAARVHRRYQRAARECRENPGSRSAAKKRSSLAKALQKASERERLRPG